MKRWLSILVALAVIASCQIQGMAEAEEEDYQYEINIIRALDLIDEVSACLLYTSPEPTRRRGIAVCVWWW